MRPDLGGQRYDEFQEEFADKIIETWARYCPNMTRRNIIARHVYTARDYACELINMKSGDIFMGAFNADQVMYNHFGYRSPIANLYNAGSAGHPGGAISGGAGYEDLTRMTGGSMTQAEIDTQLRSFLEQFAQTLKNQYVLGFRSTNDARDDKWRKLEIKIKAVDAAAAKDMAASARPTAASAETIAPAGTRFPWIGRTLFRGPMTTSFDVGYGRKRPAGSRHAARARFNIGTRHFR